MVDENWFAIYRRRNDGWYATTNRIRLDNGFVISYNLDLIICHQTHINVKWYNKSRIIKYLFKYIENKKDKIKVVIIENISVNNNTEEWTY